jgi:hypothetical protein
MTPPRTNPEPEGQGTSQHERPRALSERDPPAESAGRKGPTILLVIAIVLLVTAAVVLHLSGVVGPGSH